MSFPYTRINVIGTSGSGKTTLAKAIADRLEIPYIEYDRIHWGPNWTEVPDEEFVMKLKENLSEPAWVSDGNYNRFRPFSWQRVQLVIWLDYPFWLVFWRAVKRTFLRGILRQELWHGNKESLYAGFFTKDGIPYWVIKTYKRRKINNQKIIQDPQYAHIKFLRFTSPRQAQTWLDNLGV